MVQGEEPVPEPGTERWNISLQRYGDACIIEGINAATSEEAKRKIDKGLDIFWWGLARQSSDGSFSGSMTEMSEPVEKNHILTLNTSFFVAHASRSLYLLEKSEYGPTFAPRIDSYKAKLENAAYAMLDAPDSGWDSAEKRDDANAHRFYLKATALSFAAKLNGRDTSPDSKNRLMIEARQQLRGGMMRQIGSNFRSSPDHPEDHGANQEQYRIELDADDNPILDADGNPVCVEDSTGECVPGTDTGYHTNGVVYGQWWLMHFPNEPGNAELRKKIDKAIKWFESRVEQDTGFITVYNNTRTCADETGINGNMKKPHYPPATQMLTAWQTLDDTPGGPHTSDLSYLAGTVDNYFRYHERDYHVPDLCVDPTP